MHCGGDAFYHRGRVFSSAHAERRLWPGNLPEGNEHLRIFFALIGSVHVVVGSNDLPRDIRAELGDAGNELFYQHALTKRVFALQVFVHKVLIDHGYFNGGCGVLIGESASGKQLDAEGLK